MATPTKVESSFAAVRAMLAAAVAVVLVDAVRRRLSGDAYWDLAAGRWMWRHHAVLTVNLLSWHDRGVPWVNIEWLWGVLLYPASRLGPPGLLAVTGLGALGFFWGLHHLARAYRLDAAATVVGLLLSLWFTLPFWDFRPQVWAYGCAVWGYLLLVRLRAPEAPTWQEWLRQRRLPLGALLALDWFWSQFHGSWILLPVWLLLDALLTRQARWAVLAGCCTALAGAGPFGLAGIVHAVHLAGSRSIANAISEWGSASLHDPYEASVVLIYWVGGGLWLQRASWSWRRWVYWAGFGVAALYAVRFFPYLSLGTFEILAARPLPLRLTRRFRLAAWAVAVLAVGLAGHNYRGGNLITGGFVSRRLEPVAAVQYLLAHHLTRKVFNNYAWGGYLTYVGIPDWIDGRADFWLAHGTAFQRYADALWSLRSPLGLIKQSGAQVALVSPRSSFAWSLLESRWRLVYRDRRALVFVRPHRAPAHPDGQPATGAAPAAARAASSRTA